MGTPIGANERLIEEGDRRKPFFQVIHVPATCRLAVNNDFEVQFNASARIKSGLQLPPYRYNTSAKPRCVYRKQSGHVHTRSMALCEMKCVLARRLHRCIVSRDITD
jgi:hypothetical protein